MKVLILVDSGFDEVAFSRASKELASLSIEARVGSPKKGLVQGRHGEHWGHHYLVEAQAGEIEAADYDALLIPGGEASAKGLAEDQSVRNLVAAFDKAGKSIAAVGAGTQVITAAGLAAGRRVAGLPEEREAVERAGGTWAGEDLVIDGSVMTSSDGGALTPMIRQLVSAAAA